METDTPGLVIMCSVEYNCDKYGDFPVQYLSATVNTSIEMVDLSTKLEDKLHFISYHF